MYLRAFLNQLKRGEEVFALYILTCVCMYTYMYVHSFTYTCTCAYLYPSCCRKGRSGGCSGPLTTDVATCFSVAVGGAFAG